MFHVMENLLFTVYTLSVKRLDTIYILNEIILYTNVN